MKSSEGCFRWTTYEELIENDLWSIWKSLFDQNGKTTILNKGKLFEKEKLTKFCKYDIFQRKT